MAACSSPSRSAACWEAWASGAQRCGLKPRSGSDCTSGRGQRDMGLVAQVFSPAIVKEMGAGSILALGHTRYSTTGSRRAANAHPLPFHHPQLGPGAIAHNGNLLNADSLRRQLEEEGATFDSALDTEVMARLIEHTHGRTWEEVIRKTFARVVGAYSCGIITPTQLIAIRDSFGFRPLCIGFIPLPGQPAHVIASETCALDTVTATFVREVQPGQSLAEAGVMLKLNALPRSIKGTRVIAVDDSIVRGTTSRRIIERLRSAGASEIHMRISSPPMRFPCFMGVDIGSTKELIAAGRTVEEVRTHIGADSLTYLSIPGLMRAIGRGTADQFCRACFDGSYPVPVPQQLEMDKMQFEMPAKSDHIPGPPSPSMIQLKS